MHKTYIRFFNWVQTNGNVVKNVLTLLQVFAIFIAGFVFFFEYNEKLELDRLERSLNLIKESREQPLRNQRHNIDTLFLEDSNKIEMAAKESLNNKNLEPYSNEILSIIRENDLFDSLYATTEFYNSISICSNTGLCDTDSLCDFMYKRIKSQRSTFCPFYIGWSKRWGQSITGQIDYFLEACIRRSDKAFSLDQNNLTFCDEFE